MPNNSNTECVSIATQNSCIETSGCNWNEADDNCITNGNNCIPIDTGIPIGLSETDIRGYYNLNERICHPINDETECNENSLRCIWNNGMCQVKENKKQEYEIYCNKSKCEKKPNCRIEDNTCIVKEGKERYYEKRCSPASPSLPLTKDQCIDDWACEYLNQDGESITKVCRPKDEIYQDCYSRKVIEDKEGCNVKEGCIFDNNKNKCVPKFENKFEEKKEYCENPINKCQDDNKCKKKYGTELCEPNNQCNSLTKNNCMNNNRCIYTYISEPQREEIEGFQNQQQQPQQEELSPDMMEILMSSNPCSNFNDNNNLHFKNRLGCINKLYESTNVCEYDETAKYCRIKGTKSPCSKYTNTNHYNITKMVNDEEKTIRNKPLCDIHSGNIYCELPQNINEDERRDLENTFIQKCDAENLRNIDLSQMSNNLANRKKDISKFLNDQLKTSGVDNIDDINKIVAGVVAHRLIRHGDRERHLLHNIEN